MPAQGKVNGQTAWTVSTQQPVADGAMFLPGEGSVLGEVRPKAEAPGQWKGPLPLEVVYKAPDVGSGELRSAMRLIPKAVQWTESAIQALDAGELVQADDAMLHVHSLMPELFCCRKLGEGFGLVINAVLSSFQNRSGLPMERPQVERIRRALIAIRSDPRMSFDLALGLVSAMEDAGLSVHPPGADEIEEFLSE